MASIREPRLARYFAASAVASTGMAKTAEILEAQASAVRALLDAAFAEIAAQAETGIMIIEDEPLIALDLAHMVSGMGHRVTGIARTQAEAVGTVKDAQRLQDVLVVVQRLPHTHQDNIGNMVNRPAAR